MFHRILRAYERTHARVRLIKKGYEHTYGRVNDWVLQKTNIAYILVEGMLIQ